MKKIRAYMKLEAAMVFPIVTAVIVLILYLLFFQYDRCLMEQDIGVLAMRGCTIQESDPQGLAEKLSVQIQRINTGKYLAWNPDSAQVMLKGNNVAASQEGCLKFPFGGFGFRLEDNWTAVAQYRNQRIKPVTFIRNCRKVMGGK